MDLLRRSMLIGATIMLATGLAVVPAAGATRASGGQQTVSAPTGAVNYQLDAAHDGESNDTSLLAPLHTAWTDQVGGDIGYPLIAGNEVFVDYRSDQQGSYDDSTLEALSLTDGKVLWGPTPYTSPDDDLTLAYDDGKLFALDSDDDLTAYDASTGHQDWSVVLPDEYYFDTGLTAYNGALYLVGSGEGAILYAVNESDGSVRWQRPGGGGETPPSVNGSGVFTAQGCGRINSFDLTGHRRWLAEPTGCHGSDEVDVLHDGQFFVGSVDLPTHGVTGFAVSQRTGTVTGDVVAAASPSFDASTEVTLQDGALHATNVESGIQQWNSPKVGYALPPLIVNGYVIDARESGTVDLRDEQTGKVDWSGSLPSVVRPQSEVNELPPDIAAGSGHLAIVNGDTELDGGDQSNAITVLTSAPVRPRVHLTSGPGNNSFVRGPQSFSFDSSDPEGPFTCTLDGHSTACTSPVQIPAQKAGWHTFSVKVVGSSATDRRTFDVDTTAPTVSQRRFPTQFTSTNHLGIGLANDALLAWSGHDAQSGIRNYDVRLARISRSGARSAWTSPTVLNHTISTLAQIPIPAGITVCAQTRSRDLAGNVSPWSAQSCTTGLIDVNEGNVTDFRQWHYRYSPGSAYYAGGWAQTTDRGAQVKVSRGGARTLELRALTCSTCGRVTLTFGSWSTTISLHSSHDALRRFIFPLRRRQTGRLTLSVLSSGRLVRIDAVGEKP